MKPGTSGDEFVSRTGIKTKHGNNEHLLDDYSKFPFLCIGYYNYNYIFRKDNNAIESPLLKLHIFIVLLKYWLFYHSVQLRENCWPITYTFIL